MCFSCQWCSPLRCLCGLFITQISLLRDHPRSPAKVWMFLSPQNSVVEIQTSKVEAFGRCLGHEGGTFMNRIEESESVAQLWPILCNSMDCSPPGSSVHGILQARILEWVAIPFSRDLPDPGICLGLLHCRQILYCLSHLYVESKIWHKWTYIYETNRLKGAGEGHIGSLGLVDVNCYVEDGSTVRSYCIAQGTIMSCAKPWWKRIWKRIYISELLYNRN